MKRTAKYIFAGAFLFAGVSCSVEQIDSVPSLDNRVPMQFTAVGASETKTAIGADGKTINWSEGDAITIFDGNNANKFEASAINGASATFTGFAAESTEYAALYPYSATATYSAGVITAELPSVQTSSAAGTFDTMLNPSVAKTTTTELVFSNVAALLKITAENLGDGVSIEQIQVKANESLAGEYTVSLNNEAPAAVAAGSTVSGVTLNVAEGNAGPYYIAVLPGTYKNLTIDAVLSNGNYIHKAYTAGNVTLKCGAPATLTLTAEDITPNNNGLYGLYEAGLDLEIGGKIYNKATYGAATLVTSENSSISALTSNCGVFFIEPDANATWDYSAGSRNVLLIGNDPTSLSKITPNQYIRCNAGTDENAEFLIYNMEFDASSFSVSNYIFLQNTALASSVRIIDSKVLLNDDIVFRVTNSNNDVRSFKNIDLQGNIIRLASDSQPMIVAGTLASEFDNIILKNNIIYKATSGTISNYQIFSGTAATVNNITIENNTIVNVPTKDGYFRYGTLKEVILKSNLLYFDTQAANMYLFYPGQLIGIAAADFPTGTFPGNPEAGTCEESVFYDAAQGTYNKQWFYYGMGRVVLEKEVEFKPLEENPFGTNLDIANEVFTPISTYASYGAQR